MVPLAKEELDTLAGGNPIGIIVVAVVSFVAGSALTYCYLRS